MKNGIPAISRNVGVVMNRRISLDGKLRRLFFGGGAGTQGGREELERSNCRKTNIDNLKEI